VQQTLLQYAIEWDLQAHALSGDNSLRHSPVYGRLRPKHAVSEGLKTLAEDIRPEANQIVGGYPVTAIMILVFDISCIHIYDMHNTYA